MSFYFRNGLPFRTIDSYPAKRTPSPKQAPFKRDCWTDTLNLLAREVGMIAGQDVFVLADCDATHIRQDGQLRADARLKSQAVVLVISKSKVGPLKLPCDRFRSWQDNLRAIALSLEALRKVDRYGVTQVGEQYRGWSALPAGNAIAAAEWSSIEDAMRYLCKVGNPNTLSLLPADLEYVYRAAAMRAHPDQGGSDETMSKVNRARDFVKRGAQ